MVDNIAPLTRESIEVQEDLQDTIKETTSEMNRQTLDFVENVLAVSALATGIQALSSAFEVLGIFNEKQIESLTKMVAVTQLFTGSAQAILGLVAVVNILRNSEIALAAVETYRKVLHNPAAMGLVLAGVGAAGLVSGILIGRSGGGGSTGGNVNQTVNFNANASPSDRRQAARLAIENFGG
jgi:hypothetical protein